MIHDLTLIVLVTKIIGILFLFLVIPQTYLFIRAVFGKDKSIPDKPFEYSFKDEETAEWIQAIRDEEKRKARMEREAKTALNVGSLAFIIICTLMGIDLLNKKDSTFHIVIDNVVLLFIFSSIILIQFRTWKANKSTVLFFYKILGLFYLFNSGWQLGESKIMLSISSVIVGIFTLTLHHLILINDIFKCRSSYPTNNKNKSS